MRVVEESLGIHNGLAHSAEGIRTFHLFAGAGGGILGDLLLGHRVVGACEIEEYPRNILLQRQRDGILPEFPIWDDICTFEGKPWRGFVDIVAGGFPCQDISAAGKGAGINGERSGLWGQMARVISEIRPEFVFVENSPLLRTRGLAVVLGDLAEMGYDVRWGIMGANEVGFDHSRKRIWIAANYVGERSQRRVNGNPKGYWPIARRPMEALCEESLRIDIPAPDAFGSPNGIPDRVDRTRAVGNAQCPRMAAAAWKVLTRGWV